MFDPFWLGDGQSPKDSIQSPFRSSRRLEDMMRQLRLLFYDIFLVVYVGFAGAILYGLYAESQELQLWLKNAVTVCHLISIAFFGAVR